MQFVDERCHTFDFVKGANQILETYGSVSSGKHIIMWSGGADSTLLLYELLQAYGPSNVAAISYVYPWLDQSKVEMENRYRELFKAKLKVSNPDLANFSHMIMRITNEQVSGSGIPPYQRGDDVGFIQAASWLLSVPQISPDHGYIYMADIVNDQLDTIKHQSLCDLFSGICGVIGKELQLRRPYLLLEKKHIIWKLIELGLYDSIWFCEMPDGANDRICGNCNPCKLHLSALHSLASIDSDVPKFVKVNADDAYTKLMALRTNINCNNPDTSEVRDTLLVSND